MRAFSLSNIVKTLYTVSNVTSRIAPQSQPAFALTRLNSVRNISMPLPSLSSLFSTSAPSTKMSYPVEKSEDEWKQILTLPGQYNVVRQKGTERPGSSAWAEQAPSKDDPLIYQCAGCNEPLYKADHRFLSHCGWPAFYDAIPGKVKRFEDSSLGMSRIEIVCNNCGGHLGHVFKGEGFKTPTDERHCVNGISLRFDQSGESYKGGSGENGNL